MLYANLHFAFEANSNSTLSRPLGFPDGSMVKNLPANIEDAGAAGLIPESGGSSGAGNGNPL